MKEKSKKGPEKLLPVKKLEKITGNFLKKGTTVLNKYYTNAYYLEIAASYEY